MLRNKVISCLSLLFLLASCQQEENHRLVFKEFPAMKIGFSTQNFQKALPVNVANLSNFISYAAREGYQFVELRDNHASLTKEECRQLAEMAKKKGIEMIYEIQVNPLDTAFGNVFGKALANTQLLPGPGILRSLVSQSEFEADPAKKGWSKGELLRLSKLLDSCASIAAAGKVRLIVENLNEPFFGDSTANYGLADLFAATTLTGLQFDIGNPFRNSSRRKADPGQVDHWLSNFGTRWVTTHLKTLQQGDSQPFLTDNPLPLEEVVRLMGRQNIQYATIELLPVADSQACFDNHAKSIQFLKDKGILVN
jgi:sugar phosphate isomerase/epimerase